MTLSEKAAYLKGLMDGLKLDTEKDENKVLAAVVDMLSDIAENVADLEDVVDTISDELDCIEEDLDAIDDYLLDDEDYDEDEDDEDYEDVDDDLFLFHLFYLNTECFRISFFCRLLQCQIASVHFNDFF